MLDLGKGAQVFDFFGVKCSRAFNSNPALIELNVSGDGVHFSKVQEFRLA